jgi:hypothetical protein
MWERHHAMHVLTFFLIIVKLSLGGRPVGRHCLRRLYYHLIKLKRLVGSASHVNDIESFCMGIRIEMSAPPGLSIDMRKWLALNQEMVLKFAAYYDQSSLFAHLFPVMRPHQNKRGLSHAS